MTNITLSELSTHLGCMLLMCLGLSAFELLKTNYDKEGYQFVINSVNIFSEFSEQDQDQHIKNVEIL